MKRRLAILVVMFWAAMMLSPGGETLKASGGHETHYTIYYLCTCYTCPTGDVVGEWDVDCNGNWSGWGYAPYADPYCTETVMDIGAFCGPDY